MSVTVKDYILLPCPFCGEPGEMNGEETEIHCTGRECGAMMYVRKLIGQPQSMLVVQWNSRHTKRPIEGE